MRFLTQAGTSLLLLCLAVAGNAQNFNIELRSTLSFPGQKLANVCGYTQNGREYALVGGNKGLIIVEVTNPDNPVTIVQIPGPTNDWKEIKTYSHYAYVTSEGGGGVHPGGPGVHLRSLGGEEHAGVEQPEADGGGELERVGERHGLGCGALAA